MPLPSPVIRLVTLDALFTILRPRQPIFTQYAEAFAPFLGKLDPIHIKHSFRVALKALQSERPRYAKGSNEWWKEVIRRTALGAGAKEAALNSSLQKITSDLWTRFSSREGYEAYEDVIPALARLHNEYGVKTAVVSNADSRIHLVLRDLGFPTYLWPTILSEEIDAEKPAPEAFLAAVKEINDQDRRAEPIKPEQCLHVGDELAADYFGAIGAGMNALLIRRPEADIEGDLSGVRTVENMEGVVNWVGKRSRGDA